SAFSFYLFPVPCSLLLGRSTRAQAGAHRYLLIGTHRPAPPEATQRKCYDTSSPYRSRCRPLRDSSTEFSTITGWSARGCSRRGRMTTGCWRGGVGDGTVFGYRIRGLGRV